MAWCASMTVLRPAIFAALLLVPAAADATTFDAGEFELTIGAHGEAFYSYVLADPTNGVNNARIFDSRHNTFALSSAGMSIDAKSTYVGVRVALWFGLTSEVIYGAEPFAPGAGSTGPSDGTLWRYLQEAFVTGRIPLGNDRSIDVDAGLFVSPIGLESVLAKDNWNYSSSNLNFALPFYHVGVRATYPVGRTWSLTLGVYNGWTNVIDSNDGKSIGLHAAGEVGRLAWGSTYWTGNERPRGSPEGKAWLHHLDAWSKLQLMSWLWVGMQADVGFEPNRIDTNLWYAGALYGRVQVGAPLFLTVRADYFRDKPGDGASPLFYSVDWVSSQTVTLEFKPYGNFSFRLEYRHDEAGAPLYFDEDPTVPTERRQDVVTVAMLAWI